MQEQIKKVLQNLIYNHSNSKLTKFIVSSWPKWVCRTLNEHVLKIWMNKPEQSLNFRHNLFCDRCNIIFDTMPVSVYYYDNPGYELKIRLWLASKGLETADIDRLTGELLEFRKHIRPLRGQNLRKRKK